MAGNKPPAGSSFKDWLDWANEAAIMDYEENEPDKAGTTMEQKPILDLSSLEDNNLSLEEMLVITAIQGQTNKIDHGEAVHDKITQLLRDLFARIRRRLIDELNQRYGEHAYHEQVVDSYLHTPWRKNDCDERARTARDLRTHQEKLRQDEQDLLLQQQAKKQDEVDRLHHALKNASPRPTPEQSFAVQKYAKQVLASGQSLEPLIKEINDRRNPIVQTPAFDPSLWKKRY